MYTPMTLGELMEAQEGEGIQFKEAKNRFDFGEALRCCCALSNCGGGKLVFGISDKLWAAKHLNSPNAHVRV